MTRQVERRTELQDPRVDATGGGSDTRPPDRPGEAPPRGRDRAPLRTQRARQRDRAQDGRPLDPTHPVHDGIQIAPEGLGADDGMGAPIAQGDAGRVGTAREPRTSPEAMTRQARDREDPRPAAHSNTKEDER